MAYIDTDARARALAAAPEAEAWERAQPEYIEAERYVRETGYSGFRFIADLYEQLEAGRMLTPAQVERVQRSRQADIRATALAYRAAKRTQERVGKVIDLDRVFIPETVTAGDYGVLSGGQLWHVRIERPTEGPNHGFVYVTIFVGEGLTKHGMQFPQPYREVPGYRQWYRGELPHLVAILAGDPDKARERYLEVMGGQDNGATPPRGGGDAGLRHGAAGATAPAPGTETIGATHREGATAPLVDDLDF